MASKILKLCTLKKCHIERQIILVARVTVEEVGDNIIAQFKLIRRGGIVGTQNILNGPTNLCFQEQGQLFGQQFFYLKVCSFFSLKVSNKFSFSFLNISLSDCHLSEYNSEIHLPCFLPHL